MKTIVVVGYSLAFGALFAATIWFTTAAFESALKQVELTRAESIVRNAYIKSVDPDSPFKR